MKHAMVNSWRELLALKGESIDLYNTRLAEVRLEDRVFQVCLDLEKGHGDKAELSRNLKSLINDLFVLGLTEREQRMTVIKAALSEQEQNLTADKRNQEQLVNQRYLYVVEHGVAGARLDTKKGSKGAQKPARQPGPPRKSQSSRWRRHAVRLNRDAHHSLRFSPFHTCSRIQLCVFSPLGNEMPVNN